MMKTCKFLAKPAVSNISRTAYLLLLPLLVFTGFPLASCSGGGGGGGGGSPSGPSTPPNSPPVIVISKPSNNALLWDVHRVALSASVSDAQDGNECCDPYWSSSINGNISVGPEAELSPFVLDKGTHTITVTATDNAGAVSEASVQVEVAQDTMPGSISGRVSQVQGNVSLAGVKVLLRPQRRPEDPRDSEPYTAVTDSDGNYLFPSVLSGQAEIKIEPEGQIGTLPLFGIFEGPAGWQEMGISEADLSELRTKRWRDVGAGNPHVVENENFELLLKEVSVFSCKDDPAAAENLIHLDITCPAGVLEDSVDVNTEVEIGVYFDLKEIDEYAKTNLFSTKQLLLSGIRASVEWSAAAAELVSVEEGSFFGSGTFLYNHSAPGKLDFVVIAANGNGLSIEGIHKLVEIKVTMKTSGDVVEFSPTVNELLVLDPATGRNIEVIGNAIIHTKAAKVKILN
tara:strand:+ start:9651 stop:11018 length:1368 start_codon:yes stop_codon:yes gene_type:complete